MDHSPKTNAIFALERPDPKLWTLYLIRSVLTGPAILISLPLLYFRYYTLRYRFDDEGVHMRVGILFRREVNLTYARIQDNSPPLRLHPALARPGRSSDPDRLRKCRGRARH